jgi:opacity protein-like surface antigen
MRGLEQPKTSIMKNTFRTCCALALITPLCAGGYTSAPSTAATVTTAYESCGWFLGGGGDYMFDSEEFYWNGHLGYNLSAASSLFIEAGWMGEDGDVSGFDVSVDIVPVSLNYQYEWSLGDSLSWYLGAGIGMGNLEVDVKGVAADDDWEFMAQAFTGLVYEFTPAFEAYLGLRYLWLDDSVIAGVNVDDLDDFGVGLGLRFNF